MAFQEFQQSIVNTFTRENVRLSAAGFTPAEAGFECRHNYNCVKRALSCIFMLIFAFFLTISCKDCANLAGNTRVLARSGPKICMHRYAKLHFA